MNKMIATAMLTSTLALGASLASAGERISQRVQVADLDLGSIDGQVALLQRVDRAITEVCTAASAVESSKLRKRQAMKQCRSQAETSVQVQLAQRGLNIHQLASRR